MNIGTRVSLLMLPVLLGASSTEAPSRTAPGYTASGDFLVPGDYREWIYLSSGIDMTYSKGPPMQGASMFENVFVDSVAWQTFKRTGRWPDKTMFAMEARGAASHGSINLNGQYQTSELMGVEFHVRDDARFRGGWTFFVQDSGGAKLVPTTANCYACHAAHGALQTSFTQFYPTAKAIALKAGTFKEAEATK